PGPEPTIDLSDGQVLNFADSEFKVLFAPGHTPGHVMFYVEPENLLFCGDVIFQGSIGRTDLPGGDTQTLLNSIRTKVLTLPDDTRVLNGHGPETTVGVERQSNPFLRG
ncbi:MAG: MBL fold metallo-hydrolase, partial [Chloroflexota bacterium]